MKKAVLFAILVLFAAPMAVAATSDSCKEINEHLAANNPVKAMKAIDWCRQDVMKEYAEGAKSLVKKQLGGRDCAEPVINSGMGIFNLEVNCTASGKEPVTFSITGGAGGAAQAGIGGFAASMGKLGAMMGNQNSERVGDLTGSREDNKLTVFGNGGQIYAFEAPDGELSSIAKEAGLDGFERYFMGM